MFVCNLGNTMHSIMWQQPWGLIINCAVPWRDHKKNAGTSRAPSETASLQFVRESSTAMLAGRSKWKLVQFHWLTTSSFPISSRSPSLNPWPARTKTFLIDIKVQSVRSILPSFSPSSFFFLILVYIFCRYSFSNYNDPIHRIGIGWLSSTTSWQRCLAKSSNQ